MENTLLLFGFVISFLVVALASKQIGAFFARYNLPLISGFLFAGVIVGPFVLNMIPSEAVGKLRFIDEISLGFIAFAAGSELYLKDLRGRLKGIAWITAGQIFFTVLIGSISIYFLLNFVPFMAALPKTSRAAASIMAAAILVARSPSSAIAIINELRAKGPFTQTVLGVTVITDVAVIVLFAISSESAGALLAELPINLGFVALLIGELLFSIFLGFLLGKFITFILARNLGSSAKAVIVLALGYSVFVASAMVRTFSHQHLHIEFLLEPLLIAMIASFYITNWTAHRDQMLGILEDISPGIYIAFFTLTGASLALDVLMEVWGIALALFLIRLLTIFIGSLSGGLIAREPMQHNFLSWMGYITQAGVGLGLAKEMAAEFPTFGESFATLIIAVIVLNQVVGPPLFKWVIHRVNEAHPRGETTFDGVRDAMIFGIDDQAFAVARLLHGRNWNITFVCTDASSARIAAEDKELLTVISTIDLESLEKIGAARADTVVAMLSDEDNYRLCELFYENYGTDTLVVRLNDLANREHFRKLNALVVHPGTATVRLLDQFARKPETFSLILDAESRFKLREYTVRDPNIHGIALRDLRLPTDTLIVAVHRNDNDIVSHGYTRLRVGDKVTVIGSEKSLEEILMKFEL